MAQCLPPVQDQVQVPPTARFLDHQELAAVAWFLFGFRAEDTKDAACVPRRVPGMMCPERPEAAAC